MYSIPAGIYRVAAGNTPVERPANGPDPVRVGAICARLVVCPRDIDKCGFFRVGGIGGPRSVGGGSEMRALTHGYSIDSLRESEAAATFCAAC